MEERTSTLVKDDFFQHCQVIVMTILWLKKSQFCHITLYFPPPWGSGGKMYQKCSILGILHKDMKLIPTRLLKSEPTKEKTGMNILTYEKVKKPFRCCDLSAKEI